MEVIQTPILLVDDSRTNLMALEAVLRGEAYELVAVTSGADALAQLEARDFAVVLLDLRMPIMDGIETATRMKARAGQLGRRAPIILLTALDTDRAHVLRAYESGVVDLMQKPLETAVLSAKVAVFAELFRARAFARDTVERLDQEQKTAAQGAHRFRLLVESVKDYAIFMLDPRGFVSTWNAGAQRIKGYEASEIIGRHFSAFYPAGDAASGKCDSELEVAAREGRFEEEGWRVRKDGSRFWANVTITALREGPSGALVGFAKVTRDLTARVQHDETLRHLAVQQATLAEKARIQEFQERFVAVLGHDLRSPLSAIDMAATILRGHAAKAKDEHGLHLLDRMKASSRRMTRMIEQILDLTRTRLGGGLELRLATADLSRTIHGIADELRTAHPGRAIDVNGPPSLVGVWDPDRLEQVFSNLIGNAVNYGAPERPIQIEVRENSDGVVVSVHNDGPPIPEAIREELFNPFRRGELDARGARTAGLGLGLYISREIVVAHGGTLECSSSLHEGTTFRVAMPRASGALASHAAVGT